MPTPELSGVSIVVAGPLNPAVLHPTWFLTNDLIAENEAEHALTDLIVSPGLTAFTADWLSVQATQEKAVFATVEEAHELQLRDLVRGVLDLQAHNPVDALGVNSDAHYRIRTIEEWHAIGDRFVPKDFWEPVFEGDWRKRTPTSDQRVGLRTMTVEVWRPEGFDYVRVEVAPSLRVQPWGVYVGINAHFQLTTADAKGTAADAARVLGENWDEIRAFERAVHAKLADPLV